MEYDYLIESDLLIPMTEGLPVIENGAVLVNEGAIEACGKTYEFSGIKVKNRIHAGKKIIMPGLINCHTHLPMSLFRGLADDLPLDVWLNEHIFPAEAEHINPESVEKWSRHSCSEMLLSGTTTCCDGYFHEENVAKAVMASGIRAVLGQGVIDFPAPGVLDPKKNVAVAVEFVKMFKTASPRLYPSIFCHSPYTCSKETLTAAKQAANDLGVLFQIHVAETKNERKMIQGLGRMSIVEYLESIGILDEKTLMVHSVWIDDKDIAIIKKKGANVAHCPESNMKLASGIAPVPKLIEKGVAVGLGTDGCASNNDHDLFAEMDMAAKLHKVALLDPCVMDARTTLKMATIQGAKAVGLGHITGSIEKGKRADMILVDMDKPHLIPMYDPYSSLVYSAKASDVSLVMVDGKILVQDGKIV
ncbi:MAG: amidohydrolase [Proteobacteria bacterium]|nr:amidohydrolase [Pseudomonadota bacterium]MBU1581557.1 amidohydrolase [Pseudomonadota bacterium]MBU2627352.1 amidohydrolase [Pseudomonadota bacterium]